MTFKGKIKKIRGVAKILKSHGLSNINTKNKMENSTREEIMIKIKAGWSCFGRKFVKPTSCKYGIYT